MSDFQIRFGQVRADPAITKKFDEFWESCVREMKKNDTYNFVIEENAKLLEEAKNLKREIAQRIQESLQI